jgi:hypothetical protein
VAQAVDAGKSLVVLLGVSSEFDAGSADFHAQLLPAQGLRVQFLPGCFGGWIQKGRFRCS